MNDEEELVEDFLAFYPGWSLEVIFSRSLYKLKTSTALCALVGSVGCKYNGAILFF